MDGGLLKMAIITDTEFQEMAKSYLTERPIDTVLSIGRHHPAMQLRTHEFILRHRQTVALEKIANALEAKK